MYVLCCNADPKSREKNRVLRGGGYEKQDIKPSTQNSLIEILGSRTQTESQKKALFWGLYTNESKKYDSRLIKNGEGEGEDSQS